MRPHSRLADYLQGVEAALGALRGAYVESYQEELLTPRRANLRIRVRFPTAGCWRSTRPSSWRRGSVPPGLPLSLPGHGQRLDLPLRQHPALPGTPRLPLSQASAGRDHASPAPPDCRGPCGGGERPGPNAVGRASPYQPEGIPGLRRLQRRDPVRHGPPLQRPAKRGGGAHRHRSAPTVPDPGAASPLLWDDAGQGASGGRLPRRESGGG